MASNLTDQVRSIASVTSAVAAGDPSQTVDVNVQGKMLALKLTVNSMVEQVRLHPASHTSCSIIGFAKICIYSVTDVCVRGDARGT
jgi:hypothetical protein